MTINISLSLNMSADSKLDLPKNRLCINSNFNFLLNAASVINHYEDTSQNVLNIDIM